MSAELLGGPLTYPGLWFCKCGLAVRDCTPSTHDLCGVVCPGCGVAWFDSWIGARTRNGDIQLRIIGCRGGEKLC